MPPRIALCQDAQEIGKILALIQGRIEQSGAEQADEHRISSVFRAQAAFAQARARPARFLEAFGDADLRPEAAAALEDAEDVGRLADLEPGEGVERGDNAAFLLRVGRRRISLQPLRHAIHAVAFSEARPLVRHSAVVVQGGAPKHAAVGHHAFAILQYFPRMAAGGAATDVGHAQVAWVDKADKLRAFVIEQCVRADRIGGRLPGAGKARQHVSLFLQGTIRITPVAIATAEVEGQRFF